jgi:hypothetical protein
MTDARPSRSARKSAVNSRPGTCSWITGQAGQVVPHAYELFAVWDGKPARAYGGTADVVAYAREHGTPVRVIWPDGAQRD